MGTSSNTKTLKLHCTRDFSDSNLHTGTYNMVYKKTWCMDALPIVHFAHPARSNSFVMYLPVSFDTYAKWIYRRGDKIHEKVPKLHFQMHFWQSTEQSCINVFSVFLKYAKKKLGRLCGNLTRVRGDQNYFTTCQPSSLSTAPRGISVGVVFKPYIYHVCYTRGPRVYNKCRNRQVRNYATRPSVRPSVFLLRVPLIITENF